MIIKQTLHTMPALVLGVVLFARVGRATGASWRSTHPEPPACGRVEGPSHGVESIHTYRGGPPSDSPRTGNLNLGNAGGRMDGSRTTSWPSYFNVRSGEIPHHDVGDGGIPLWRW